MRVFLILIAVVSGALAGAEMVRAAQGVSEFSKTRVEMRITEIGGAKQGAAWATLEARIFVPENAGDLEVGVRDVRGGVMVMGEARGNAEERTKLLALPLVNGGELQNEQWPLDVVLRHSDGAEIWQRRLNVSLTGAQHPQAESRDLPGARGWKFPVDEAMPPWVIEPGLVNVIEFQQHPRLGRAAATGLLLTGPCAIVALLLVRGLFRRGRVVMLAAVLAMAGISAAAIAFVSSAREDMHFEMRWTTTQVGAERAVTMRETLGARMSLFSSVVSVESQSDEILMPVAESAHDYWAMRDLVLKLTDDGTMRLKGMVPARQRVAYELRSVVGGTKLPGYPATDADRAAFARAAHLDFAQAWWVAGGYCYPGLEGAEGQGQVFTTWAASQPASLRSEAQAWYELRFDSRHRYLLQWDRSEAEGLRVVNWSDSQGP